MGDRELLVDPQRATARHWKTVTPLGASFVDPTFATCRRKSCRCWA